MEPWLILLACSAISFILFSALRRKRNLPPGPRGLPIVGNLLQLGPSPHVSMANMARTHGPLIALRLGTQTVVVGSSPSVAELLLKTHGVSFAARPNSPQTSQIPWYRNYSLVWSDCTDLWKKQRTICRSQLFSARMLRAGADLRNRKVDKLVGYLRSKEGTVTDVSACVFHVVYGMMTAAIFSQDPGVDPSKMKDIIRRMHALTTTPNLADYFPALAPFDLQGLHREATTCHMQLFEIWERMIAQRKGSVTAAGREDFLDVLLASGLEDREFKPLLTEMFLAGGETIASTIGWIMAELIKQPKAMAKLRDELSNAFGEAETCSSTTASSLYFPWVMDDHKKKLPYLQACVKETLRLRPPVPIVMRRALETRQIMGHTIPKGTQVLLNLWALGRDPTAWPDPLAFMPERFVDSRPELEFKGVHYEFLPFGSGRRMCPGMPFATEVLEHILAALVHHFEWSLPQGMVPSQLNMEEMMTITLQRKFPLQLIPKVVCS